MKKLSILTLAFVILVPMLLSSCNKNDIVGSYELNKKDAMKFGTNDGDGDDVFDYGTLNLDLEEDGSFTISQPASIENENMGTKVKLEVVVTGKWEFEGLGKGLKLNCKDFEINNIKGTLNGVSLSSSDKKEIKAMFESADIDDFNEQFKGMKVIEIDDEGFTVEEDDNDKLKFKRV